MSEIRNETQAHIRRTGDALRPPNPEKPTVRAPLEVMCDRMASLEDETDRLNHILESLMGRLFSAASEESSEPTPLRAGGLIGALDASIDTLSAKLDKAVSCVSEIERRLTNCG